jgi:DNA polymerase-3 subunit gamma/tau
VDVQMRATPVPKGAVAASVRLACLEDVAALAAAKRDLPIKHALEHFVRLVRIDDGRLEVALAAGAPKNLVGDLASRLSDWTGKRWLVAVSDEQGGSTLAESAALRRDALKRDVRADPLVEAVLARFPGAEIVDVRRRDLTGTDPEAAASDREPPAEPVEDDRRD